MDIPVTITASSIVNGRLLTASAVAEDYLDVKQAVVNVNHALNEIEWTVQTPGCFVDVHRQPISIDVVARHKSIAATDARQWEHDACENVDQEGQVAS